MLIHTRHDTDVEIQFWFFGNFGIVIVLPENLPKNQYHPAKITRNIAGFVQLINLNISPMRDKALSGPHEV